MDGANASAMVYSMVETAKANGADVYLYLKYLLTKTPTDLTSDEELEKLCPWDPSCKEALVKMGQIQEEAVLNAG